MFAPLAVSKLEIVYLSSSAGVQFIIVLGIGAKNVVTSIETQVYFLILVCKQVIAIIIRGSIDGPPRSGYVKPKRETILKHALIQRVIRCEVSYFSAPLLNPEISPNIRRIHGKSSNEDIDKGEH
jgi:hypothetical protein